jgi:hypothetical protein
VAQGGRFSPEPFLLCSCRSPSWICNWENIKELFLVVVLAREEKAGHRVLFIRASGKLSKEDYEHFVPEVERLIEHEGKIRLLFEMHDFHGWQAGALWEDIKFDLKHFADIERLAMVGEKKWEEWMAAFCRPFTSAEIHYFDRSRVEEARRWIVSE